MKLAHSPLYLMVILFALYSCSKESLKPQYQPITVNQLLKDQPVRFSYHLDDTPIEEYGKGAGKFPIFGKLFKAMVQSIANTKIVQNGGFEMNPDPIVVDLSDLLKIDFKTIDKISLDQLKVNIRDSKSKDNLKFVDKVEIFALLKEQMPGLGVNEDGYTRLLYFDRTQDKLGCEDKCLSLNVEKLDWKKLLQENPNILIKSKIFINSVPLTTMKLAGSVEFSVKFNVGF